ncbi:hypothetical protein [Streptomyces sp. MUSC 125]|uniref:hypothetical protein n=1 Tax=Streptomyces sp. MUSC 125 TaxID=1428624 RepID=UPI002D21BEFF|nr:hypothetical protein [Streptomyces sp. MUSC 125]
MSTSDEGDPGKEDPGEEGDDEEGDDGVEEEGPEGEKDEDPEEEGDKGTEDDEVEESDRPPEWFAPPAPPRPPTPVSTSTAPEPGVRPDRWAQVAQGAVLWSPSISSATAICCERLAWSGLSA